MVGGGLIPVRFEISWVKKFKKKSHLFFHQMEAFLGVSPEIKRN